MNYAAALADFSRGLEERGHVPQCLAGQTRPALDTYRNNLRENRVASLGESYPTVRAVVGEEFFAATARVYVAQVPSRSANLHEDGGDFSAFLESFAPVSDLPYLADVARLDWALYRAHYAPEMAALTGEALSGIALADFARARLVLHPAMALVQSTQWPIERILDYHHGGELPDLSAGGEAVWVWRDHWQRVGTAEAACLACWLAGSPIEEGLLAASLADAAFDPAPLLVQLFGRELVNEIRLEETT